MIAFVKLKYNKMIYKVPVYTKIIIISEIRSVQIDKVQKFDFLSVYFLNFKMAPVAKVITHTEFSTQTKISTI